MIFSLKSSVVTIALLTGCSGDAVEWTEWPIAPGAENIRYYDLKKINARQVSFEIDAEYPSKLVAEFYSREVKSPWVRCYQEMEWQSFGDAGQTPPAFIHQMLLHWAHFENDRLLILALRYVSEGTEYRKLPDTGIQNVHLVEYQETSVESAVASLGLACERT